MLDELDADAVRRWSRTAVERLAGHRTEIDALNVFPVADGDTGSNMLLTLRAADEALREDGARDAAAALAVMSAGAARGAIGNSGFIVSQILRGLAEAVAGHGACDVRSVVAGLDTGAVLARSAVVTPVEGTMLTVARAAADAARGDDLGAVLDAAVIAADAALQRTPDQLAELAEHGVVDAGGRGLLLVLDALARTVTGVEGDLTPVATRPRRHGAEREAGSPEFGFEVQYLLDADEAVVDDVRADLAELGDSVAVVGVGGTPELRTWKVHVHTNDVGAAIETGVRVGSAHQIEVVRFADQLDVGEQDTSAVVAVAPGLGVAHLFEAEGVQVVDGHADDGHGSDGAGTGTADDVPSDGPVAAPDVEHVVTAIRATGAAALVLLPNSTDARDAAEAAAGVVRSEGVRVSVVPTRSPVQGLAAVAVHDATRRFDDDVVAMAEAAAATRFAELTVATTEGLTAVGICQPGDVLGLIDGEVVEIGHSVLAVAFDLVDRLLAVGAELMTVLIGADAPRRAGSLIEAHVRGRSPLTDVTVYDGGQLDHPVIIGVE